MADIKQAAEWMEEGRRVRMESWPSKQGYCQYLEKRDKYGAIQDDVGCRHELYLDELRADDWEIAP